nr:dual specificity mitogen-activated protein kinase kinase 7 [Loxodonta africana]
MEGGPCWTLQCCLSVPSVDEAGLGRGLGCLKGWLTQQTLPQEQSEAVAGRPQGAPSRRSPLQVSVSMCAPSHPPISVGFYPSLQFGVSHSPYPHPLLIYDLISFLLDKSVVSVVIYCGVVFFLPFPHPVIVITLSPAPAPSQRAALQLPLANDGGNRSPSSESSPQHPTPPVRPRHMLGLPSALYTPRSMESIEIDQKLQEIMKQTGYLTIGGQRYQAEINDLENLGEMGSGTCGQVWKMCFRKTGHIIAVKQMRRSGNKEENKRILMDLDVVLKSHDCPYIVQCFGTFITNTDVFIAMELMGTCAEKLKKRMQGPIPERILGKMTVAIVKALFYLKEKHGVIHRDVKPSNILLDERGQIKLCDFGISGRLVDSKAKTRSAGCAAYMAPERIDPPDPTKPDYDIRADVWSLGISLVELATGQFPYKNCKTDFEVLTKVLQEEPPLLPGHMGFSGDFQSFVKDW